LLSVGRAVVGSWPLSTYSHLGQWEQQFQAAPPPQRAQPGPTASTSFVTRLYCGNGNRICPVRPAAAWEAELVEMTQDWDVVVVGGGAAGLSATLTLARARRSVLVVDDGQPRNAPAEHIHGFLTRDGTPPGEFLALGRAEVRGYGAEVLTGRVVSAEPVPDGFTVTLADGTTVTGRRLLVATGLTDALPDLPGLAELWGKDVLHCPYCHGWEVRDQHVGVLSTGPFAVHQAQLFRQWTPETTLLVHTGPRPTDTEAEELAARDIAVVHGEVASLRVAAGRLTGVVLHDGETIPLRALVIGPDVTARADVPATLGLGLTDHPMGVGTHIAADPTGRTSVPGVWVAGNVTDVTSQVIGAAAAGTMAAAAINADLIAEEVRRAVTARPATLS
jgi:thioredoxin reductase